MSRNSGQDILAMEGKTFIIGREGHIYIDSGSASKHHAEIKVIDGKIHLRDLNSTNGTYLIKNKSLVHFDQGYVNPMQPVMIGDKIYRASELLAIAGEFYSGDDAVTEVNVFNSGQRKRA